MGPDPWYHVPMSTIAKTPEEFLLEVANAEGIACSTVTDGHVLIFTRKILMGMLAKMDETDADRTIVFVKRHDFPPPDKAD